MLLMWCMRICVCVVDTDMILCDNCIKNLKEKLINCATKVAGLCFP